MHYLQSPHINLLSTLFGEADNECIIKVLYKQVAKKVGFMACHWGKLLVVCTSPRVFLSSPKNILMSSIDYSSSVL